MSIELLKSCLERPELRPYIDVPEAALRRELSESNEIICGSTDMLIHLCNMQNDSITAIHALLAPGKPSPLGIVMESIASYVLVSLELYMRQAEETACDKTNAEK